MNPRKPDFHCHSSASDGALTPQAVVELAHARGVDVLALTDHDTTAGLAQIGEVPSGLTLIGGIEISARSENLDVHVLGLAINLDCPGLQTFVAQQSVRRLERGRNIAERLERKGLRNAWSRVSELAGAATIGRPHFARLLVADGLAHDHQQAFEKYLKRGRPGFASIEWPSMDEAVAAIHDAGGLAVLAHPLAYRLTATRLRRLCDAFDLAGGDGLEVVCGWQNPDATTFVAELARARGLQGSCGSDFHAPAAMHQPGNYSPLPSELDFVWDQMVPD